MVDLRGAILRVIESKVSLREVGRIDIGKGVRLGKAVRRYW